MKFKCKKCGKTVPCKNIEEIVKRKKLCSICASSPRDTKYKKSWKIEDENK